MFDCPKAHPELDNKEFTKKRSEQYIRSLIFDYADSVDVEGWALKAAWPNLQHNHPDAPEALKPNK